MQEKKKAEKAARSVSDTRSGRAEKRNRARDKANNEEELMKNKEREVDYEVLRNVRWGVRCQEVVAGDVGE